ncbi:hypothetical protein C8J56DRAFT_1162224 [Mycena floridula]|nr:hypothetical protein C8J56DRAFT_1162224 [Mycena floridula]
MPRAPKTRRPQPSPLPQSSIAILTDLLIFLFVGSPAIASLVIHTEQPTMSSTTTCLITLGLTAAAIATILFSAVFGRVSHRCYHSVILTAIWFMTAAFKIFPLSQFLDVQLVIVVPVLWSILLVIAAFCVRLIHTYFGVFDTRRDWNEAFEGMSVPIRLGLLCCFPMHDDEFVRERNISSLA